MNLMTQGFTEALIDLKSSMGTGSVFKELDMKQLHLRMLFKGKFYTQEQVMDK